MERSAPDWLPRGGARARRSTVRTCSALHHTCLHPQCLRMQKGVLSTFGPWKGWRGTYKGSVWGHTVSKK